MGTVGFGTRLNLNPTPPPILGGINGGEEEVRTPDLSDANAALSQLSYFPMATKLNVGLGCTSRVQHVVHWLSPVRVL
jgi:hypothetical protein